MIEKIHIIITLLAAVIVTIVGLFQHRDMLILTFELIFTIVLFYILGSIVKSKLKKLFEEQLYEGLEVYNIEDDNADTSDAYNNSVTQQQTSHIE